MWCARILVDKSAARAGHLPTVVIAGTCEEREPMSHIPVNHHLRPLYRALAVVIAAYVVVFGVVGVIQSADYEPFAQDHIIALGLRTNLAFSIASIVAGGLIVLSVLVGRGLYYLMGLWGGVAFMVVGLAMLTLLRTDLNVLNFSIATVIVSFVIGMVLFSAGLYGRSGSVATARAEEAVRHGR
jgi:hypothetical protein